MYAPNEFLSIEINKNDFNPPSFLDMKGDIFLQYPAY